MSNITMATSGNGGAAASPILRGVAHLISYIFHPLFINAYVMAFLIFFHPYAFVGLSRQDKVFRFVHIALYNTLVPIFVVFLMWRLQFVKSMLLRDQKDRIGPYIVAMIFYWWTWMVFKNLPDIPATAIHFLLGSFLAICGGWICNIFYKVSMHAIGMGGALMFFCLFGFHDQFGSGLYIAVALVLTGLVCTSRLILSAHSPFDVWSGLFIGLLSQYIAWWF
jgi:membrane-associated phospholipid phosphatase